MAFVKLHATILDSSVWHQAHSVVKVWVAMLALADQDGMVHLSAFGLQKRAAVSREELDHAIDYLEAPDADSRDKSNEGRRIEALAGGWFLFNHGQYRDRQTDAQVLGAARAKRFRDKRRECVTDNGVTQANAPSRDISTEAEAEQKQIQTQKKEASPAKRETAPLPILPVDADDEAAVDALMARKQGKPKKTSIAKAKEYPREAHEIAQYLFDAMRDAGITLPTRTADAFEHMRVWLKQIHLGMTKGTKIGGRNGKGYTGPNMTVEGAKSVIDYAHRGDRSRFWSGNLKSGDALRVQYPTLLDEMKRQRGPKNRNASPELSNEKIDALDAFFRTGQ